MVPIRTSDPIGAIGAYWATEHQATEAEVRTLAALADTTAVAIENVQLWTGLETLVADRTHELEEVNRTLRGEVRERRRAEALVRALSVTDELTGLLNRRGFLAQAESARAQAPRTSEGGLLAFLDVDGLKQANDALGHDRGDLLLRAAADVLRTCFRKGDVVARLGGDEFAAYVPRGSKRPSGLRQRLERATQARNARGDLPWELRLSLGVVPVDPTDDRSLPTLLAEADAAMYREKRARTTPTRSRSGSGSVSF